MQHNLPAMCTGSVPSSAKKGFTKLCLSDNNTPNKIKDKQQTEEKEAYFTQQGGGIYVKDHVNEYEKGE